MDNSFLINKILELKEKRNAVIVAHNYQIDEIQEIADVVGDSLALSKFCVDDPAKTIVFCGVHFMAESAKLLSPEKTVLLPEIDAGCPMADMVNIDLLNEAKKKHPHALVVCYINTSAEVKAGCDICCTSSNAIQVISSQKEKDILFIPDKNLGRFIQKNVPEKNIILWDGFCVTHNRIKASEVEKIIKIHEDARLLVHPECQIDILQKAHFIGSTKQIIDYATKSPYTKFIIGTEMGILYKLKKDNPQKTFYILSQGLICPNMKKTSLKSVYNTLNEMKYEVNIDEGIRLRAKRTLDKMLEIQ